MGKAEDDAFKSYVQENTEAQLSQQSSDIQSGSAIAAQREMDQIAFSKLLRGDETAEDYLAQVRNLANTTPLLYSDLTAMSKSLAPAFGDAPERMLELLQAVGDAGSSVGLDTSNIQRVATAISRMESTGKTTLESLNMMQERGIDAYGFLADGLGKSKEEMLEMVSKGLIPDARAARMIQDGMEGAYAGAMALQSATFSGLSSTVEGLTQEMQAAYGEGYNETRNAGLQEQIDYLSGESGAAMQEANRASGAWYARLENEKERLIREAQDDVLESDAYKTAMARGTDEGYTEAGRMLMEANLKKRITSFLTAKKIDGLSTKTLKNYREMLTTFAAQVDKHVAKITTDDIRAYIGYLADERGLKDSSIQTHISTLRSFFSWLDIEDIIKKNPMRKIKSLKIDRLKTHRPLTQEELERLRDGGKTYKEKALVEFFVSTGCRLSEAQQIRVSKVNWQERSVTVLGKGNKERTVYFSVRAKLMLQPYLKARKGGEALFSSARTPYDPMKPRAIQKALQKIGERAKELRRIHPHLMRHTFAGNALNGGMDLTVIQQLLGHTDPKTTLIYAELRPDTVKYAYEKVVA